MNRKSNIHFDISERKILLWVLDIVLIFTVLYTTDLIFKLDYFKFDLKHLEWSFLLVFYITTFATIFELYDLKRASHLESVVKNIILTSSVTTLCYLLTPFLTPELPENRLQIVYFFINLNIAFFLWRYTYITLIATPRFFKRVLIIGDSNDIGEVIRSLQKSDPNYKVMGFVNTGMEKFIPSEFVDVEEFKLDYLKNIIVKHGLSEIVISSPHAEGITVSLYSQLIDLLENGFSIREYTQVYEELTQRVPVQHIDKDFYRFFPFSRSNQNKLYLFLHRLMDIIISILGLCLGLLVLPLVFLGNLIANRGPLFYKQERVGKNGMLFKIIKLRTMIINAETNGAVWAKKNDKRITTFGKFLRRSRLDEIPQFLNVLKGEMSVIGPRPERPVFVEELSEVIPFYETRHMVSPGLTGWAQVNANYGSSYDDALEKLQYDLYYIKHRSLFLDISIVLKTLSTIIFYRGQ